MTKKEKCILCDEEIKENLLSKPLGSYVKIKRGEKNENYIICQTCQKNKKDKKDVEALFSN